MHWSAAPCALLVALSVAITTGASPTSSFSAEAFDLEGEFDVIGVDDVLLIGASPSIDIAGTVTGHLELVTLRSWGAESPNGASAQATWHLDPLSQSWDLSDAEVRVGAPGEAFQFYVSSEGGIQANLTGEGRLQFTQNATLLGRPLATENAVHMNTPRNEAYTTIPGGEMALLGLDFAATVRGSFAVFVQGTQLSIIDSDGHANELSTFVSTVDAPGSVFDPMTSTWSGPGTHPESIAPYAILTVYDGQISAKVQGAETHLSSPGMVFTQWQGQIEASASSSASNHGSPQTWVESHGSDQQSFKATQDGDRILIQRMETASTLPSPAGGVSASAAVAASGALAFAILMGFLRQISAFAVAGYARILGEDVLKNPRRTAIYDALGNHAGASLAELAALLGLHRTTIAFHVEVLARNELVRTKRSGRTVRVYHAIGSRMCESHGRKDSRERILQVIRQEGSPGQRELMAATGLARSTIHYHVAALEAAGRVTVHRSGQRVRYHPTLD